MYSTFNLTRRIARGSLREAALAAHEHLHEAGVVIFDESTFSVVDVDLSGSAEDVARRIDSYPQQSNSKPNRRRGRPKLGVIGREVTLLPRHWEWLAQQPGGASVTLRKLVSAARKDQNNNGNLHNIKRNKKLIASAKPWPEICKVLKTPCGLCMPRTWNRSNNTLKCGPKTSQTPLLRSLQQLFSPPQSAA